MRVEFLPEAKEEVHESIGYYDEQLSGLGDQFATDLGQTVARILDTPCAYTPMGLGVRKCNLSKFQTGVLYRVNDDLLLIVAVMDLRRRPGYWKKRLRRHE